MPGVSRRESDANAAQILAGWHADRIRGRVRWQHRCISSPGCGRDAAAGDLSPRPDIAVGWTPDGTKILFNSSRQSFADSKLLYTIAAAAGAPGSTCLRFCRFRWQKMALFSPDGTHIAYEPIFHWQRAWKRYNGGQTLKVWLAEFEDSSIIAVPRENSDDFDPMWVGDEVYFLSDRGGHVGLWATTQEARK